MANAALHFAEGAKAERGGRWGSAGGGGIRAMGTTNNNSGSSSGGIDVDRNAAA